MARTISLVNQKGGVGKTTTSINLGAYLASLGKKVLLIDLDPQANATSGLGIDENKLERGLYEFLSDDLPADKVIYKTNIPNLHLLPSSPALAGATVEMISVEDREYRLSRALKDKINDHYDFIIIDSQPSLGILTINGLVATDDVIIPVQSEYYALEGLGQLLETIKMVQENLQPKVNILGALVTMYDRRVKLARQVLKDMRRNFPYRVFETVVPRNIRLSEAPSFGQSILEYDKLSKGARAYRQLAEEIIKIGEEEQHDE